MLRKLRQRIEDERGFTLIELLVVMLIIGILAAIALPIFLGQQDKGKDASAKSNVRNLVSHIESCYAETESYGACNNASALDPTGIPFATTLTAGSVTVVSTSDGTGTEGYVVSGVATSNNHEYRITKSGSTVTRNCDTDGDLATWGAGNDDDDGACNNGTW